MVTRSPHLAGRGHRDRRQVLSDGSVTGHRGPRHGCVSRNVIISDRRVQAVSRFDVVVRGKMKITYDRKKKNKFSVTLTECNLNK